jgi:hypothetical protein
MPENKNLALQRAAAKIHSHSDITKFYPLTSEFDEVR